MTKPKAGDAIRLGSQILICQEYFRASSVNWVRYINAKDVKDAKAHRYVESRYVPESEWMEMSEGKL